VSEQKIDFTYYKSTDVVGESIVEVDSTPLMEALVYCLDNDTQFRKTFISSLQKGFRFHLRNTDGMPQGNVVNGNVIDLDVPRTTNNLQADLKKTLLQAADFPAP